VLILIWFACLVCCDWYWYCISWFLFPTTSVMPSGLLVPPISLVVFLNLVLWLVCCCVLNCCWFVPLMFSPVGSGFCATCWDLIFLIWIDDVLPCLSCTSIFLLLLVLCYPACLYHSMVWTMIDFVAVPVTSIALGYVLSLCWFCRGLFICCLWWILLVYRVVVVILCLLSSLVWAFWIMVVGCEQLGQGFIIRNLD
jgi:hypothetical protein